MKRIYEQGVSLIELLVAVTILAIGVVPLVGVIMYGLETGNRAAKITQATNFARDLAEEIRTKAFAEEFVYTNPSCKIRDESSGDSVYPEDPDDPQCFGKETTGTGPGGVSETVSDVAGNGGRIMVFDDIDDYDGWCRGIECPGGNAGPLETYDGFLYNGTQGYQNAIGFTRRVRIHNLDVGEDRSDKAFYANPFPLYTTDNADSTQFIKRYDFRSWSNLTTITYGTSDTSDDDPAEGLTPFKRIEVTVTYNGGMVSGVEVVDVSYAVMPYVKTAD